MGSARRTDSSGDCRRGKRSDGEPARFAGRCDGIQRGCYPLDQPVRRSILRVEFHHRALILLYHVSMTAMPGEHNLSPILVTGAHRSGTTWAGKMLAADADTAYISEPLNVLHRPGVFKTKVKYWYQYICDDNEGDYLPAFQGLLDYDYHLWDEI